MSSRSSLMFLSVNGTAQSYGVIRQSPDMSRCSCHQAGMPGVPGAPGRSRLSHTSSAARNSFAAIYDANYHASVCSAFVTEPLRVRDRWRESPRPCAPSLTVGSACLGVERGGRRRIEDRGGRDRGEASARSVLVVVGAVEKGAAVDERGRTAAVEIDRLSGAEPGGELGEFGEGK